MRNPPPVLLTTIGNVICPAVVRLVPRGAEVVTVDSARGAQRVDVRVTAVRCQVPSRNQPYNVLRRLFDPLPAQVHPHRTLLSALLQLTPC